MISDKKKFSNTKRQPPKRKTIVILSIVGAILIAAAVFAIVQRNNIMAAKYSLTYTQEEISEKIQENDQRTAAILNKTVPMEVRDLTADEKEALAADALTVEEAVKLITEDYIDAKTKTPENKTTQPEIGQSLMTTTAAPNTTASAPGTADASATTDDVVEAAPTEVASVAIVDNAEAALVALIAEAYVLRAHYSNSLEAMKSSAIAEYSALDKEKQNQTSKMNISMNYMDKANSLEVECDRSMDDLIAKITIELQQSGGDMAIINEIKNCYAEEKSLKKAYYMSFLNS